MPLWNAKACAFFFLFSLLLPLNGAGTRGALRLTTAPGAQGPKRYLPSGLRWVPPGWEGGGTWAGAAAEDRFGAHPQRGQQRSWSSLRRALPGSTMHPLPRVTAAVRYHGDGRPGPRGGTARLLRGAVQGAGGRETRDSSRRQALGVSVLCHIPSPKTLPPPPALSCFRPGSLCVSSPGLSEFLWALRSLGGQCRRGTGRCHGDWPGLAPLPCALTTPAFSR